MSHFAFGGGRWGTRRELREFEGLGVVVHRRHEDDDGDRDEDGGPLDPSSRVLDPPSVRVWHCEPQAGPAGSWRSR